MHEKKKFSIAGWRIVLTILIASLATVGISYAAWSDTLNVIGKVTTGAFDMVFQDDMEQYTVSIVNGEGSSIRIIDPWDYDLDIVNDGKKAEISFSGPLPLDLLAEGYYMQFTYPIISGKGTVTQVKQYQPDFSEPW